LPRPVRLDAIRVTRPPRRAGGADTVVSRRKDSQLLDPTVTEIANVRPASVTHRVTPTTGTGNLATDVGALLGMRTCGRGMKCSSPRRNAGNAVVESPNVGEQIVTK